MFIRIKQGRKRPLDTWERKIERVKMLGRKRVKGGIERERECKERKKDTKLLHKSMTQKKDTKLFPSISLL